VQAPRIGEISGCSLGNRSTSQFKRLGSNGLIIIYHPILATICTLCEASESNNIDSGAIQINCIIIFGYVGEGNSTAAPFQRWQHRWPLTWVCVHQTIIIKHDETIPFTVNIILCQHYCSVVAVKQRSREWHDGVVQCSVSVSESLPLRHEPANKYYVIVLCWHQSHAICFVLTLVLISVQRTMFTGFMLIVKITPHSTRLPSHWRVNCICFLGQDTML